MKIETRYEKPRGCGFRKPGGLYMVCDGEGMVVDCLPIPMHVCPTCNQGIKPTRSFQWIVPRDLFPDLEGCEICHICPLYQSWEQAGLMWVGDKYYTPISFMQESHSQGISKRIPAVPVDFQVGKHWIYLGHRHAIKPAPANPGESVPYECHTPGIFTIFRPERIEYVVSPEDDKEKLERMEKRGITLVDVKPIQNELNLGGEN